ncbi:MAG: hypothetical protein QXE80_03635 [Pyrobaculum sp.]
MYQLIPTYPFSKKLSKTAQPVTGYQLQFTPFEESGVAKQIIVLDIDTPNAHLIANYIMAHLGLSRTVKSVRGMHIYYKMPVSDVKRLKPFYYLRLVDLLERGIIDEAYAKQFITSNKHAWNVYKKHRKMLFPIEVKTKRIMAPGSIVFPPAEKLLKKLAAEGKIDFQTFDPESFLQSHFAVSAELYKYKLDFDKPIHEDLAEISADDLLNFFHQNHSKPSITCKPTNHHSTVKQNITQEKKKKQSPNPFVYSCPSFGKDYKYSTLSTADYVAKMLRKVIAEPVQACELDYRQLVREAVERRIGVIVLARARLCPLHNEKNPSVAFYETNTGIRMFEFHKNRTRNVCKSLEELLFALHEGREVRMKAGDGHYAYALRLALADSRVNSEKQVKKTSALYELVAKLNTVADLKNVSKAKLNRLEKVTKVLLALAANFATTFADDIFSARFAERIVEFSKSSVHLIMQLLVEAGAIGIVGNKHVGYVRKALVYTVPFETHRAYSVAVRILVLLGILKLPGKQSFSNRGKETKLILSLPENNPHSLFVSRTLVPPNGLEKLEEKT